MKISVSRTVLTSLAIAMLLGGTTAAFAATPTQTLNASMQGAVTNLGNQTYAYSGGQVVYAYIGGQPLDTNTGSIRFSVFANQNGMNTNGFGNIQFSGTVSGMQVSVTGTFGINGEDMGAGLPANCTTTCTEVLPFDFIGSSNVRMTMGGQSVPETLVVESPYWNPYGGPIYLVSPDSAIVIVATYTQATILWTGAQTGGYISGTLGSNPVSGTFSQTSIENENLVTGTATDTGTIQFNTNIASLNSRGTYSGSDYIPSAGSSDCSPATLPYTCTLTGFQSNGNFRAPGMSGTYSTSWGVPAYGFTSTVSATVGQTGSTGNHGGWGSILNFLSQL